MGYGEKKKNNWGQGLRPKSFNDETYSHAIACHGYLKSNQNVLIDTKDIKKWITRRYFFILRSKIAVKQRQVRNFAEVRIFAWHRQPRDL